MPISAKSRALSDSLSGGEGLGTAGAFGGAEAAPPFGARPAAGVGPAFGAALALPGGAPRDGPARGARPAAGPRPARSSGFSGSFGGVTGVPSSSCRRSSEKVFSASLTVLRSF